MRQAKAEAKHLEDPVEQKRLENAISDLDNLVPKDVEAAKQVVKDPKNEDKKANLDKLVEATKELIDELSGAKALQREQEKQMRELEKAAERGDLAAVKEIEKNIDRNNDLLATQARDKAAHEDDPNRKKDILKAVDELSKLIPEERKAAEEAAAHPEDKAAQQKLKDIDADIKQAMDQINSGPEALKHAVDKQKEELEAMKDAARRGDQKEVDRLADRVGPREQLISNLANTEANKPGQDPDRKKQLQDLANELAKDVPTEIKDAKELAKNPSNPKAAEDLNKIHDKVKFVLQSDWLNISKLREPPHLC